ncbi:Riboflavin biosynthesis protein RibF [uncultured Desulfobacterium sp.]|uniref:Riboflavin biosynthesis protein n=1 Tax=uncultured Desulfobacterium sp. TaxID=201089 RepID=A0A445MZW6_9BACT|nr:Riboflavin biosynthesis protein RibF [uncultured Desulfobacterium sp.]
MTVISDLDHLEKPLKNPVLTIGNFDGVHKGHLALFDKVKERAAAIGGQSVVMTFEPHPIKVMSAGDGPPLITPTERKLKLIENAGIDVILCMKFTGEFARISPQDFVKGLLVERIGVKEIVVGYDYCFGHKRSGDIYLLEHMGNDLGFLVHVVAQIFIDGIPVSSTNVRNLVQEGHLLEAKKLLGRNYQVCGTVVKGKDRGAKLLGFPTANLKLVEELTPKRGVYAVRVFIDDKIYNGLTNIGYNPTFGNNAFSVETHVLDFSQDLVGKTIKVSFIERLRDEKTFKSIEELSRQIKEDSLKARELFRQMNGK